MYVSPADLCLFIILPLISVTLMPLPVLSLPADAEGLNARAEIAEEENESTGNCDGNRDEAAGASTDSESDGLSGKGIQWLL